MLNKKNRNEHQLNLIIKDFKQRFKNLEKIDNIKMKSTIEFETTGSTSYSAFLWQEKLVNMYHIFATLLGIIDARYEESNRLIEKYKNNNSINEVEKEITNNIIICNYRSNVVKDYLDFIPYNEVDIIKNTLMQRPSYTMFDNLIKNMETNKYQLSLQKEVILAYKKGYDNSLQVEIDSIIDIYHDMLKDYAKKIYQRKTYMCKKIEKKKSKVNNKRY